MFYYNKIIEHYNDWIIIYLLVNKKTRVEFDSINALILEVITTYKVELFKVNWYRAINANDKAAHNFYMICFTPVPYTLHDDVE